MQPPPHTHTRSSLFMGVTMPVDPPPGTANVYILAGGTVAAVDQVGERG